MDQGVVIVVAVVPASGPTTEKEMKVASTVTVAEALEKAGYGNTDMEISLEGRPVTDRNMRVGNGASIHLKPRITVTERPRGS